MKTKMAEKKAVSQTVKIRRSDLVKKIAKELGYPEGLVREVCDSFLQEIEVAVVDGKRVSLPGFGYFSLQHHKGHRVQFNDSSDTIQDYTLMKFSASVSLKRRLRDADKSHNKKNAKAKKK